MLAEQVLWGYILFCLSVVGAMMWRPHMLGHTGNFWVILGLAIGLNVVGITVVTGWGAP